MSAGNASVVRQIWERIAEAEELAFFPVDLLDPEAIYEDEILPDHAGESYRGREGMLRAWARWTEPWEAVDTELVWIRESGDSVVSFHRVHARGRESGIEFRGSYAYLWRFRNGLVTYCRSYPDAPAALAAAGISEVDES